MKPIDLRRSERHLLAAVHGWARTNGWYVQTGGWICPEQKVLVNWWYDELTIVHQAVGDTKQRRRDILVDSVRQAVDLLVVYGVLPAFFSSAYGLGEDRYREQVETLTEELQRAQGAYRDVVAGWAERADMFTVGARVEIGGPR